MITQLDLWEDTEHAPREAARFDFMRLPDGAASDVWRTPGWLLEAVQAALWPFDLDSACTSTDKVARHGLAVDAGLDGLTVDWLEHLERLEPKTSSAKRLVWCNPPYGGALPAWMDRCATMAKAHSQLNVVALVPARVETRWWANSVIGSGATVIFLTGRVAFVDSSGVECDAPPFGCALVIWRGREQRILWADARALRSSVQAGDDDAVQDALEGI